MSSVKIKKFIFNGPINLYCFADVHIGNKGHDSQKFNKAIDQLKKDPNGYCFFNGDTIDFTPPGYHDATNEQDQTLDEQVKNYMLLLKSLGKKVLFIRSGNHEARQNRTLGLDLMKLINKGTQIPIFHEGYEECWIFIGKKRYRIVTSHGEGGGSASVLNRLSLILPGADIYFTGHTHQFNADLTYAPYITVTGKMIRKLVAKIAGGSFQGMADYARNRNMIPTQTGCYVVSFNKENFCIKETIV